MFSLHFTHDSTSWLQTLSVKQTKPDPSDWAGCVPFETKPPQPTERTAPRNPVSRRNNTLATTSTSSISNPCPSSTAHTRTQARSIRLGPPAEKRRGMAVSGAGLPRRGASSRPHTYRGGREVQQSPPEVVERQAGRSTSMEVCGPVNLLWLGCARSSKKPLNPAPGPWGKMHKNAQKKLIIGELHRSSTSKLQR